MERAREWVVAHFSMLAVTFGSNPNPYPNQSNGAGTNPNREWFRRQIDWSTQVADRKRAPGKTGVGGCLETVQDHGMAMEGIRDCIFALMSSSFCKGTKSLPASGRFRNCLLADTNPYSALLLVFSNPNPNPNPKHLSL